MATLLAAFVVAAGSAEAFDKRHRYHAWRDNGELVSDNSIRDWHSAQHEPRIQNRAFFEDANPARVLRDMQLESKLVGPYVEMANGDIVGGRLIGIYPADHVRGLPPRAVIALTSPLRSGSKQSEIHARPEYVVRAVYAREPPPASRPGTVEYADGRKEFFKAVRFTPDGIRALTGSGGFRADYGELAAVGLPADGQVDRLTALLDDLRSPCPEPESFVTRLRTTDGSVLTYRSRMRQTTHHHGPLHLVQPAWSWDAIAVRQDTIAGCTYWRNNEIPLSLLPAETLDERSYTGFLWPWRRDRNVRGGPLAIGELFADVGIGTHSYSAIAFDLPPGAEAFSAWIGIDASIAGGCAVCGIYRDRVGGQRLWQSGFLRGSDEPVRVQLSGLRGAKRLVLVTDFGETGRPPGSDAFDIRDEVDWLMPTVKIDRNRLPPDSRELTDFVPQLAGWKISKADRQRIEMVSYWHPKQTRWMTAMRPNVSGAMKMTDKLFSLSKTITVSPTNAWVAISAAKDNHGQNGHLVDVLVNGEKHPSIMNGDVKTNKSPGDFDGRVWSLGPFVGQKIELTVAVHPMYDGTYELPGILWEHVSVEPIIRNLPADGQPIQPDVPLTSLKFLGYQEKGSPQRNLLARGKLTDGQPLEIRNYAFHDGFGILGGERHEVVVHLDPSWRRFVAVIGLADGAYAVGPYEILLDDELYWQSSSGTDGDGTYGRQTTAEQISVEIPPGHKKMTLRVKGHQIHAGFAHAGFTKG